MDTVKSVNDPVFDVHAQFCRVCGSPTRLRLMWLMKDGERTVGELSSALGLTMANVSQHLRVMRNQKAVICRREGKSSFYSISSDKFLMAAALVREGLVEVQPRFS